MGDVGGWVCETGAHYSSELEDGCFTGEWLEGKEREREWEGMRREKEGFGNQQWRWVCRESQEGEFGAEVSVFLYTTKSYFSLSRSISLFSFPSLNSVYFSPFHFTFSLIPTKASFLPSHRVYLISVRAFLSIYTHPHITHTSPTSTFFLAYVYTTRCRFSSL